MRPLLRPVFGLVASSLVLATLAACGGSDTADRLDLANPALRLIHASPFAPNVTLTRAGVAQTDETNVAYGFASNYFDIDTGAADWVVKTTAGGVALGASMIDPLRGTKYTIVALPTSATETVTLLFADPYNKPLASDSSRLRVVNGSYNAANIDVYMNPVPTDITAVGVTPLISATAFRTAGPASNNDSVNIPGAAYQLSVTAAGTKTVLFRGTVTFTANRDVLLVTVPNAALPTGIKVLMKIEGGAGLTELAAS